MVGLPGPEHRASMGVSMRAAWAVRPEEPALLVGADALGRPLCCGQDPAGRSWCHRWSRAGAVRHVSCARSPRAPSPAGGREDPCRGVLLTVGQLAQALAGPGPAVHAGGVTHAALRLPPRTGPHPMSGLTSSRSSASAQPGGCALAPQAPRSPERTPLFLQSQELGGLLSGRQQGGP